MRRAIWAVIPLVLAAGCVSRPEGEDEERALAEEAGRPFAARFEERALPALPAEATADDVVLRALQANADLEQRYWEWRVAIERIPQESTSETTAVLMLDSVIRGGMGTFLDRSSLQSGSDPMANIPGPGKLAAAGRVALEDARAAGLRFEKARLDLKAKAITAWWEWAVLGERIRLKDADLGYLTTILDVIDARVRAGALSQGELLKTRIERDMVENDLRTLESRLPARLAELNAILSRLPREPLTLPAVLPPPRSFAPADDEILVRAATRNPELQALAHDLAGREEALELAHRQYIPDFALGGSLGLGDLAASVFGMITMPFLRRDAIEGRIAGAEADIRKTEAMRRQVGNDLAARLVLELYVFRNADRELRLFDDVIVPQADQAVTAIQGLHGAGRVPLNEILDSLRTWIGARATLASLRGERETALAAVEALAAVDTAPVP